MDPSTTALLASPSVGFFTMLVIGIIAGWIAERVSGANHGLLTNLLVGVAGAFVGATLAQVLEIPIFGFWRNLLSATIGAILVLWIWRNVRPRA